MAKEHRPGLPRVRIYNPEGAGWLGTKYEVDGQEIGGVTAAEFSVAVDALPTFTFCMRGMPDIDMVANLKFSFSPGTVNEAARVLQKDYYCEKYFYNGMIASIESVLPKDSHDLAVKIAKRILGVEDDEN